MKPNLFKSALLAAGAALLAQSAHANTVGYTAGDVILGVEATSGTGSSYDYEVDLGSITKFTAGNTINFNNIVLDSDLSSTSPSGGFGAGYANSPTLFFSAVGDTANTDIVDPTYTGNLTHTLYKDSAFITALTTPSAEKGGTIASSDSQISSASTGLGALTATTSPNGKAAFDGTSTAASYTYEEYNNGGSSEQFSQPTTDQLSLAAADAGSTLNLYILNDNGDGLLAGSVGPAPDLLGDFSFENGDLIFNPESTGSTPEPSTYALLMLGVGALVGLARRRALKS